MEELIKLIGEMKQADQEWDARENLSEIEGEEVKESTNLLIGVTRELLRNHSEAELADIRGAMGNDRLYDSLVQVSEKTLRHYHAWELVRNLEKDDPEMVEILLQNMMDKYVARLEFDFQETNELYGVEDQDVFYEALRSCDKLVEYYVCRHYSRKEIIIDLMEETEVQKETADILAELIEKNYDRLQRNVLIDLLAKKNRKY